MTVHSISQLLTHMRRSLVKITGAFICRVFLIVSPSLPSRIALQRHNLFGTIPKG